MFARFDAPFEDMTSKPYTSQVMSLVSSQLRYITPKVGLKLTSTLPSVFYYDMEYRVGYSTFCKIPKDNPVKINELPQSAVLESLST